MSDAGMALGLRGELRAVLGGQTRCFRLDFNALAAIEAARGAGIVAIARRFSDRSFGVADVVAVLHAGLAGGGLTVADAQVADWMMETGFAASALIAAEMLSVGLALQPREAGAGEPRTHWSGGG